MNMWFILARIVKNVIAALTRIATSFRAMMQDITIASAKVLALRWMKR